MKTVRGGKVAIKTNDLIGPYFATHKGVRQGDPFSPLLFNLVADGLASIIQQAQEKGLICGLIPHIIPNVVVVYNTLMILSLRFKIVWKELEILNLSSVSLNTCLG
jgi:hypothetical protein